MQASGAQSVPRRFGARRPNGAAFALPHRHAALTLLELLITLAVIALLAAFLLPLFARARTAAQRTVCLSNMHQIALAIQMYVSDYDASYPALTSDPLCARQPEDSQSLYSHDHFCRATDEAPGQVNWVSLVSPYAPSSSPGSSSGSDPALSLASGAAWTFHCPADPDWDKRPITSYEFKLWLAENHTESDIPSPPEMLMVWEQWAYHIDSTYTEYDRRAQMNVALVDGHVRWLRLTDTTSAQSGSGPNLHGTTTGLGVSQTYNGIDLAQ